MIINGGSEVKRMKDVYKVVKTGKNWAITKNGKLIHAKSAISGKFKTWDEAMRYCKLMQDIVDTRQYYKKRFAL